MKTATETDPHRIDNALSNVSIATPLILGVCILVGLSLFIGKVWEVLQNIPRSSSFF